MPSPLQIQRARTNQSPHLLPVAQSRPGEQPLLLHGRAQPTTPDPHSPRPLSRRAPPSDPCRAALRRAPISDAPASLASSKPVLLPPHRPHWEKGHPGASFVEHVQTYLTQLSLDATKPLLSFKKGHSFTLLSAILIDRRLLLFIVINLGSTAWLQFLIYIFYRFGCCEWPYDNSFIVVQNHSFNQSRDPGTGF